MNTAVPEKTVLAILRNEENRKDPEPVMLTKQMLEEAGYEVIFEDEKEFMARGRPADCDCELISCVCTEARQHKLACRYRKALTCAVAIDCEPHGFDVCPECDPCTCKELP